MDLDPSTQSSDQISVFGDVTVENGAKILATPGSQIVPDGSSFTVLTHEGDLTGAFEIADGTFVDYEIEYKDDAVLITTNLNLNASGSGLNGTENQVAAQQLVSAVLLAEGGLPGGNFNVIGGGALSGSDFDQVHSELYGAAVHAIQRGGLSFGLAMKDRLGDREQCGTLRGYGQESCRPGNEVASDSDFWLQGAYRREELDTRLALDTTIDSLGIYGGLDSRQGHATVGLAGGVDFSTVDDPLGEADSLSIHAGGYISQPLAFFNLNAMASYNFGSFEAKRNVNIGALSGTGTADQNVGRISGEVSLTQEYQNPTGIEIQPEFGVSYQRIAMDGFNEGGTLGNVALTVNDFEWNDTSVFAGVSLRQAFKDSSNTIIPEVRVNYQRSLSEDDYEFSTKFTSFATAPVTILSETPKAVWSIGAGLNLENGFGMVAFGDIDYRFSDINNELAAQGGIRLRF